MTQQIKRVAVIGAAGKMGRGIALLLLQEMARSEAESTGNVGRGEFRLTLIDADEVRLNGLWIYLKPHLVKYAGQNINALRRAFAKRIDLIENSDMIEAFVEGSLAMLARSTDPMAARGSELVFEAVAEELEIKVKLLRALKAILGPTAYYFSNTSSIPIGVLDREAGLDQKIIGFHFYNPPPLQKLVELIPCEGCAPELVQMSEELGKRLGKRLVHSRDIAGFIGNGHFMREVCYACQRVQVLAKSSSREEAITFLNRVTQNYLLRPMGIFQLIDYVGIDVCHHILATMQRYLPKEQFAAPLLDEMLKLGIRGGQEGDGTQRPGFFRYEQGKPIAVFALEQRDYGVLPHMPWFDQIPGGETWSRLVKDPKRAEKLRTFFQELSKENHPAAEEARTYLHYSKQVAEKLVKDGVAARIEDVNAVLELGFGHLYGA